MQRLVRQSLSAARWMLFLLLLLPLCAQGQRTIKPELYIGAKAGATLSFMSFSPSITQRILPGFTAGAVVRYAEENIFGIIGELSIAQRGWRENYPNGEPFSYSRTLTYIQIPFMAHIRFGSDKFKGFVNLGPEVGYMLGSKISANFDYKNIGSVEGYPQGYRTNKQLDMAINSKFDYGIVGGLGAEWRFLPKQAVTIEGRFYFGLGNIFSATKKDYFSASRTMSVEITAAWMFRIK